MRDSDYNELHIRELRRQNKTLENIEMKLGLIVKALEKEEH